MRLQSETHMYENHELSPRTTRARLNQRRYRVYDSGYEGYHDGAARVSRIAINSTASYESINDENAPSRSEEDGRVGMWKKNSFLLESSLFKSLHRGIELRICMPDLRAPGTRRNRQDLKALLYLNLHSTPCFARLDGHGQS